MYIHVIRKSVNKIKRPHARICICFVGPRRPVGSLLPGRALGAAGMSLFAGWLASARFALATMFVVTAVAHFTPMRRDLIASVPMQLLFVIRAWLVWQEPGFKLSRSGAYGVPVCSVPVSSNDSRRAVGSSHDRAARSSSAMSSFFIRSMACIAFGCLMRSGRRAGTICQERPNLSLSQPH